MPPALELPAETATVYLNRMTARIESVFPHSASWEMGQILRHVTGGAGFLEVFSGAAVLDACARQRIESIVEARAGGTPLAHVLGRWPFLDMSLEVTPDTFIPRPETEGVVREFLKEAESEVLACRPLLKVLDLGCGTGAIALGAARGCARVRADAVEVSAAAAETALQNIRNYDCEARIRIVRMDYLHESWEAYLDGPYDAILANPPYIADGDYNGLPAEVRREPRGALLGGVDGDEILKTIIARAGDWLVQGGRMILEMGMGQGEGLRSRVDEDACLRFLRFARDHQELERVMVIGRE
ncbi:MAG: peptide chain release factor N(5)-glutamine methyltransferase [Candidatus Omnitrophica bacterium]|nr:peptide chain release factor N(5)-glutamine methyltransferase [Candidatus Omnitrophota bacterium]